MAKKTYKSLSGIGYTFPVKVNDKINWISISGEQLEYSTSNKQIQEAIEKTSYFSNKEIGIAFDDKKIEEKAVIVPSEFPEATDLNEVVAILKGEPYKVSVSKMKNKEDVLKIAQELGASFPNPILE